MNPPESAGAPSLAQRRKLRPASSRALAGVRRLCSVRRPVLRLIGLTLSLAAATLATAEIDPDSETETGAWAFWIPHDPASAQRVDHGLWQTFLDAYVHSSDDGINRVAYRAVTEFHRALLDDYLAAMSELDPRTLNRDEQYAYWINLYNALTVAVVLRHPSKGSILRMGEGWLPNGPWDDELLTIAGEPITLNDIEHRILRPIWNDHRVHFAVNCASIGCPNLAAVAYARDNLDEQLNIAEYAYLTHPRGVRLDGRGRLTLSSIFDWYQTDFGVSEKELLAYLSRHLADHDGALADVLSNYHGRVSYDYDWSLNEAPSVEQ